MERKSSSTSNNNNNDARRAGRQIRRALRRGIQETTDTDAANNVMAAFARSLGQKKRSRRSGDTAARGYRNNASQHEQDHATRERIRNSNNEILHAKLPPEALRPRPEREQAHCAHGNNEDDDDDDDEDDDALEFPPDNDALHPPSAGAMLEEVAALGGDPWLDSLVGRLREIWAASDLGDDTPIDLQKARNVLEASAGNVALAAQLYWDDFIANHAAQAAAAAQMPHQQSRNQRANAHGAGESEHSRETDPEEDGEEEFEDDEVVRGAVRRVRRRLDDEFVEDAAEGDHDVGAGAPDDIEADAANLPEAVDAAAMPRRGHHVPEDAGNAESVSVSDDETSGLTTCRMVGRLVAQIDDIWARNLDHGQRPRPPPLLPTRNQLPEESPDAVIATDLGEVGLDVYDQVLFEAVNQLFEENAGPVTLKQPIDLLWGMGPNRPGSESTNENGSNVIAVDEETAVVVEDNSGVPRTWLNAGFHLSSCGTGLIVKTPPKDEIAFFTWRQQQNARGQRSACPPPYHCRAITGILSVVTALLYSGASIQGDQVNCSSARTPFAELSSAERTEQFESRLADALAALLFIATQASLERKKQVLAERRRNGMADSVAIHKMERRLRLCPTCWWDKDPNTGEPRLPEGRDPGQPVQLSVSYTNIQDLHTYVLSNLRCFMARGGCALFLETIIRIHGRNVIKLLLARARRHTTNSATTALLATESLISCTCEERQKRLLQEIKSVPSGGSRGSDHNKVMDVTPPGHECLSIELLALLLTGEVHSTLHGWSVDHLGIGLLSSRSDQVGWQLRFPVRPVWILRGPTCYSVLWHKEEHKEVITRRQQQHQRMLEDAPGQVLELSHWNCWYNERNKSELRLMTARGTWVPPLTKSDSKMIAVPDGKQVNRTVAGILERRRQQRIRVVSADVDHHMVLDGNKTTEDVVEDDVSNQQLLDRVRIHPDDVKYHPKDFKLCRFDVDDDETTASAGSEERKPRGEHWTPFYRLTHRQRRLVQMKLGPKMAPILETRWPRATILKFLPEDAPYPIV